MFALCSDWRSRDDGFIGGIKAGFAEKTPVKAVSIYLAALAVLFYFLWLSEIVPVLVNREMGWL